MVWLWLSTATKDGDCREVPGETPSTFVAMPKAMARSPVDLKRPSEFTCREKRGGVRTENPMRTIRGGNSSRKISLTITPGLRSNE